MGTIVGKPLSEMSCDELGVALSEAHTAAEKLSARLGELIEGWASYVVGDLYRFDLHLTTQERVEDALNVQDQIIVYVKRHSAVLQELIDIGEGFDTAEDTASYLATLRRAHGDNVETLRRHEWLRGQLSACVEKFASGEVADKLAADEARKAKWGK